MARANLFARLSSPGNGGSTMTPEAIHRRIAEAEVASAAAERAWRRAALGAEAGGDTTAERAAEDAYTEVRLEIARLEAMLSQAQVQAAEAARAAQAQLDAKADAEARKALNARIEAARTLVNAIEGYVNAFGTFRAAHGAVRAHLAENPRMRDVFGADPSFAVSREIARQSARLPIEAMAPGAVVVNGELAEIIPLVNACAAEARAAFQGG